MNCKKVGFVYTEFQQNILLALCIQENIHLDVLFIRDNISINKELKKISKEIIFFTDISYSWKNIITYINSYKKIFKYIDQKVVVYTWSIENPIVRLIINSYKVQKIIFFEDGIGSYISRNFLNLNKKNYILTKLINFLLDLYKFSFLKRKNYIKYSLYNECCLDYKGKNYLISKDLFKSIVCKKDSLLNGVLKQYDILFIQQSFIEMGILNEEDYIFINKKLIKKLINKFGNNISILWKLHPRTDREKELKRLDDIKREFPNLQIDIMDNLINIENVEIDCANIKIVSFYSSALYVLKVISRNLIYAIYEPKLAKKYKEIENTYNVLKKMNIDFL